MIKYRVNIGYHLFASLKRLFKIFWVVKKIKGYIYDRPTRRCYIIYITLWEEVLTLLFFTGACILLKVDIRKEYYEFHSFYT